jgi:hypothetical protein
LTVTESPVPQGPGETIAWAVNVAAQLATGETPSGSPTATLTDLATGADHPTGLTGTPTISGTTLTQTVKSLVYQHRYRLVLTYQTSLGNTKQSVTIFACVLS